MNNNSNNSTKPCLVQTAQGFTVSYNQKFLYSKYNPQKAINQIIQNLTVLPQTVILCVSPVLNYGLAELSQKLPQDCLLIGCELDDNLFDFIQNNKDTPECNFANIKNFTFISKNELYNLGPQLIKQNPGTFRRIIRVDFSAAAQFNSQTYDKVIENVTNALMTWWANRVTLVKFGRKYCSNFFKNLSVLDKTTPIQKYLGTIEKPILVFGAGESAQNGIEHIKQTSQANYFILCADTALQPLLANNITPDGVFIEEAQNVICKCFIGTQKSNVHIFAGLSSVHSITRYFKPEQISYFTTEFTGAVFIDRFEKAGILPPKNEPFGSVGITAWYYAMLFRRDNSVPVQTYGLDFAYSAGRTHTKGAMADNARFISSSRIKPDANYAAAFCQPAFKNGDMYTTPIMVRYKEIMTALREPQGPQMYAQGPQMYAQGPQMYAKGPQMHAQGPQMYDRSTERHAEVPERHAGVPEALEGQKIKSFLQKEKVSLQEIKALLTGETILPPEELKTRLTHMISEREYLYLHFPDGHKFQYTQSFLNRVRVEVDYFLKVIS